MRLAAAGTGLRVNGVRSQCLEGSRHCYWPDLLVRPGEPASGQYRSTAAGEATIIDAMTTTDQHGECQEGPSAGHN